MENEGMDWIQNEGRGTKIVIIDSGINVEHELLGQYSFDGICINTDSDGNIVVGSEYTDELGHGTAVSYICKSIVPKADIFIVKIFYYNENIDENILIAALKYVADNIKCDIINISCGVHLCEKINDLKQICLELTEKGIIIVSAFDNYGRVSYPAAFSNVIGVDATLSCYKATEYQFVEGNMVNIRGSLYPRRLPGLKNDFIFDGGASFVAPYISALISKMLSYGIIQWEDILNKLRNNANYIYRNSYYEKNEKLKPINNAVLFPFNKEMHSFVRYSDQLDFEIYAICDTKYSQNIGKNTEELLKYGKIKWKNKIKNIEKLNWDENFDTVILGNTKKTREALKSDIRQYILEKCLQYDKNVYCYEEDDSQEDWKHRFAEKGLSFYCPTVIDSNVRKNTFGKLYECARPILLVAGTSPKQGKFNLQIRLRNELIKYGYNVGQLGTEPTSILFGMDEVYNMGFNSTVHVSGGMAITYVNELIHQIELKSPDIIIAGSQSQTLPSASGNLGYYSVEQYEFLLGVQPDACILCVTVLDDVEYVQRTINFLQSINSCTVLCIMLFPYKYTNSYGYLVGEYKKIDDRIINDYKDALMKKTKLKVFNASKEIDYKLICEECISFFSEE